MKNFYFTCGQNHIHNLPYQYKVWNKDNVLKVIARNEKEAIGYINDRFGSKWANVYDDSTIEMGYFKGGVVDTIKL